MAAELSTRWEQVMEAAAGVEAEVLATTVVPTNPESWTRPVPQTDLHPA
jgi:hypothetical protein